MRSTRKQTLAELINKIDWVTLNRPRYGSRFPDNALSISFTKSKKIIDYADTIRLRIGPQVIKDLGWQVGDKILAQYDRDDIFYFVLVKSEIVGGRTLSKESHTSTFGIVFRWNKEVKLEVKEPTFVDFEIHEKWLGFRLPQ